jgi:hypothetical protein
VVGLLEMIDNIEYVRLDAGELVDVEVADGIVWRVVASEVRYT